MAGIRFPSKIFVTILKHFKRQVSSPSSYTRNSIKTKNNFPVHRNGELLNKTVVFHLENALLRSNSFFPYFMLVAFEAGGLLRSLILFLSYPLVWLLGEDQMGLQIMVFLCFFGVKKETFRIGASVLPKFYLEDVGLEGFEAVRSYQNKVAVSNLPKVMIENFLNDYLGVEAVVARDMKSLCGYFLGLMKEYKAKETIFEKLEEAKFADDVIGMACDNKPINEQLFSYCKEVYLLSDANKRSWHALPKERYPKPLIFHDARLAFRPTLASSLAMFMWIPFGLVLFLIRFTLGILLPFNMAAPILFLTGVRVTLSTSQDSPISHQNEENPKGMQRMLYVCNHRTLLDPLFISYVLDRPISAVVYSVSRFNELVSPIKTIRLTRDREKDRETMQKLLNEGNLVVCPEGTTCREPYLLRFSPLFAELTDDIVPVALDTQVSMFYGTTATGHKSLDPFFIFLNPNPTYIVKILEGLPKSETCQAGGKSRIEVANYVQNEIAEALGFTTTSLTRKDKYMILAGNEGIVQEPVGKPSQ